MADIKGLKPAENFAKLQTENRNARSAYIDRVSTQELCHIINQEDVEVPRAIQPCIPVIAEAIDALAQRVRSGGRVFYIGAGTSGRLGVLDASEIPPTYSAPAGQFVAMIAGGDGALRHAKEGAEDSREGAEADLKACDYDPTVDSLIGIASSGRTPYVLGGLAFARSVGSTTVGVVCVDPSAVGVEGNADHLISAVTGPEVVTGSTRMKAGTVTKLVLNMISTGIMIKLGKTYGNLMIDMKATNVKLQQRSKTILRSIAGSSCKLSDKELDDILIASGGSVKLATVTIVLGVTVNEAADRLQRNQGVLSKVFDAERERKLGNDIGQGDNIDGEHTVLCVDAGGTGCRAVVMTRDGAVGHGAAGPCNVSNIGVEAALSTISAAIQRAVDDCEGVKGHQFRHLDFSSAWVGMAGYGRPSLVGLVDAGLSDMLRLRVGKQLRVTADIDILPAAMDLQSKADSVLVLVAGTGSVAMSYERVDGVFERTGRVGGWGYLLGDDGSGYGIGREALRRALRHADDCCLKSRDANGAANDSAPLYQAIVEHFRRQHPTSRPEDLLSSIVAPDTTQHRDSDATLATTKRIAGVAKTVLDLARTDNEAKSVVDDGVASLVQLVVSLARSKTVEPTRTGLILAGGLMQHEGYRQSLEDGLGRRLGSFTRVECVADPAMTGARFLQGQIE